MSAVRRIKRRAVLALACGSWIALLTGAGGGAASSAVTGSGTGSAQPTGGAAHAAPPVGAAIKAGFSISGSVQGLYPGAKLALDLHLVNQLAAALTVTSVTTVATSPSALCSSTNLTVSAFAGHLALPAHGATTAVVSVGLAHSAPNGCQGVVFALTYEGLATHP